MTAPRSPPSCALALPRRPRGDPAGDPALAPSAPPAAGVPRRDAEPARRSPTRPARATEIERITFAGAKQAREAEVRRHLLVARGRDRSTRSGCSCRGCGSLQLGWFSRVETRVERGQRARARRARLRRRPSGTRSLVTDLFLGSTGPQPLYGGLGLSQQNFLGRGFGLSGAFVYGGAPRGPARTTRTASRCAGRFFAPDVRCRGGPRGSCSARARSVLRGEELACGDPDCEAFGDDFGDAPRLRYQRAGGEVSDRHPARARSSGSSPTLPRSSGSASSRPRGGAAGRRDAARSCPGARGSPRSPAPTRSTRATTSSSRARGSAASREVTFASRAPRRRLRVQPLPRAARDRVRAVPPAAAAPGRARRGAGQRPVLRALLRRPTSPTSRSGPALARALELNFSTDSRYDALRRDGRRRVRASRSGSDSGFFRRGYLALGVRGVYSTATLGGARTPFSRSPVSGEARAPPRHARRRLQRLARLRRSTSSCDRALPPRAPRARSRSPRARRRRGARPGRGRARAARGPARRARGRARRDARPRRRLPAGDSSASSATGSRTSSRSTSASSRRAAARRRRCHGRVVEILFDVWDETLRGDREGRARAARASATSCPTSRALRRFLSEADDVDLGPRARARRAAAVRLEARVELNPVSKEQLQRTREFIANPAAGRAPAARRAACSARWRASSCASRIPGADVHLFRSRVVRRGRRWRRGERGGFAPRRAPPARARDSSARRGSSARSRSRSSSPRRVPLFAALFLAGRARGGEPRRSGSTRASWTGSRRSRRSTATCSRPASSSTPSRRAPSRARSPRDAPRRRRLPRARRSSGRRGCGA